MFYCHKKAGNLRRRVIGIKTTPSQAVKLVNIFALDKEILGYQIARW
jgi:hypothetical protein